MVFLMHRMAYMDVMQVVCLFALTHVLQVVQTDVHLNVILVVGPLVLEDVEILVLLVAIQVALGVQRLVKLDVEVFANKIAVQIVLMAVGLLVRQAVVQPVFRDVQQVVIHIAV